MKKTGIFGVTASISILAFAGFYNPNTPPTAQPVEPAPVIKQDPTKQIAYKPSAKGFPRYLTKSEKDCLVENLYHEARGESKKGQEAVVYVVLNRAMSETRQYGKSSHMCDIVKAPNAFSWYDGTKKVITDRDAWVQATGIVDKVLHSYSLKNSPVADATHYVNKKFATAKAKWWKSKKMTVLAAVGSHTFFKQKNEVIAMKRA